MKSSDRSHDASVNPPLSPQSRKRKRSSCQTSAEEPVKRQQQVLSSLLTSQKRLHSEALPSSPSKHNQISSPGVCPASVAVAIHKRDMYSFSSRTPMGHAPGAVEVGQGLSSGLSRSRQVNPSTRGKPGMNPQVGAKKLVVKNLKTSTGWDSKAYLEKIWGQLEEALSIVFKSEQTPFSREDLYRGVENVCRQGGASILFSRLEERVRKHVQKDMLEPLLSLPDTDSVSILKIVLADWATWKDQMTTIRAIFFFLDRSYLLSSGKFTLDEFTSLTFREEIFSTDWLKTKVIDGACELIASDRKNPQHIGHDLFQQSINLFYDLSIYTSAFEPRFLGTTQQYISTLSTKMITEMTIPEYVALADGSIKQELDRCTTFNLAASTRRDLLTLLEEHLITTKTTDLVDDSALAPLLDAHDMGELTRLYALLNRRRLGDKLRPAFEKWIDTTGTSIVFSKDEDNMVVQLLALQMKLNVVWVNAFLRNESLGHGYREAFETFMNKTRKGEATWGTDNTKVGEMIAKYVDQLLRGGVKAVPEAINLRRSSIISVPKSSDPKPVTEENDGEADVDEDVEVSGLLDQVLDLFRFVHGKAVFEAFYKKDLARRLLMGRSASADAEQSMLARLKTECGSNFTQNLEQMFKDVELSREELQSYKQRLESRVGFEKGKSLDLSVNVLSAAAWPTYGDISVIIPTDIKRTIDDFEMHYKSKHSGRKLDWKHALAQCQMRASFNEGPKELVVSSFQAVVLLLFNGLTEKDHLGYHHILSETGMPEAEVKRTLQSLACAKLRPLTKHPKSREIETTDTFTVNVDFKHPKYRVKINQIQLRETKEENQETHIRVAEDRNFECQAAIVRILKSRKTISHQELISETIKATMSRGVLAVGDIKRNIDRLIEKEYMEREDGNMYNYLA